MNDERELVVRCRVCTCGEAFPQAVGHGMNKAAALLLQGHGAVTRSGGCDVPCRCHLEYRAVSDGLFKVTIGAPYVIALPRRPQ